MKIIYSLFAAAVLFVMPADAQQEALETRQHFAVTNGEARFTATRIDSSGDPLTRYAVLLRDDTTGKRFLLAFKRNYAAQTAEYRMVDLATKELIAVDYKFPLTAKNRAGTAAELRNAAKSSASIRLKLSTAKASEEIDEHAFRDAGTARATRLKLKGSLSADFRAVLDRLHLVGSVPPLSDFCVELLSFFSDARCSPNPAVRLATIPPDCAFDAAFGEACSAKQAERAKAVRKNGHGNRY